MDVFFNNFTEPKPLLKWVGGKSRLSNVLIPKFLSNDYIKEGGRYIEPFVGSAAMAIAINHSKMILNDKNIKLMNFYHQIKQRPQKTYLKINKLTTEYNSCHNKEEFFYKIRKKYNDSILNFNNNGISHAAWFWFLNKTGFNGMYRETKKGKFNIPFGKRNCPVLKWQEVLALSKILKNCKLYHKQFDKICTMARNGDFVYLDPPYLPLSKTSNFSSYLRYKFGLDEHALLCEFMEKMHLKNVNVVMSNSNSPLTYDIYGNLKNFYFHKIDVQRLVSGNNKGRKKIKEVIITNVKSNQIN